MTFPPGDLIDTMARLIGRRLTQELWKVVVIENKLGTGRDLGAAEVSHSAPGGCKLTMASPPLTISPTLYAAMTYRPEQIVPAQKRHQHGGRDAGQGRKQSRQTKLRMQRHIAVARCPDAQKQHGHVHYPHPVALRKRSPG